MISSTQQGTSVTPWRGTGRCRETEALKNKWLAFLVEATETLAGMYAGLLTYMADSRGLKARWHEASPPHTIISFPSRSAAPGATGTTEAVLVSEVAAQRKQNTSRVIILRTTLFPIV